MAGPEVQTPGLRLDPRGTDPDPNREVEANTALAAFQAQIDEIKAAMVIEKSKSEALQAELTEVKAARAADATKITSLEADLAAKELAANRISGEKANPPPRYSGETGAKDGYETVHDFLYALTSYFGAKGWTESDKRVRQIPQSLSGHALTFWRVKESQFKKDSNDPDAVPSWTFFRNAIIERFGGAATESAIRGKLFALKHTSTVEDYIVKFETYSGQLVQKPVDNATLVDRFIDGLAQPIKSMVATMPDGSEWDNINDVIRRITNLVAKQPELSRPATNNLPASLATMHGYKTGFSGAQPGKYGRKFNSGQGSGNNQGTMAGEKRNQPEGGHQEGKAIPDAFTMDKPFAYSSVLIEEHRCTRCANPGHRSADCARETGLSDAKAIEVRTPILVSLLQQRGFHYDWNSNTLTVPAKYTPPKYRNTGFGGRGRGRGGGRFGSFNGGRGAQGGPSN